MQDFINKLNSALLSSPWYWVILLLSGIIIFVCIKYGAKIIGWFGEHWTKQSLDVLDKDKYIVLNDIMISVNGKTHQIDHIVLSKYGIFVIETKQYNGYIKGNDYDKKWEIYSGRKKYYVNNPVHQNYGHIQSLKELLSLNDNYFVSIVCISSNARINIKSGIVVELPDLVDKIKTYNVELLPNYNEIYDLLDTLNIKDKSERRKHIKYAKETKSQNEKNSIGKCPKCGGDLVARNGKYGSFLGCSNYPKCKYTEK
jgi:hypothetical protein